MAYDGEGAPVWAEPTLLAVPVCCLGRQRLCELLPRVTPVLNGMFVGWGSWRGCRRIT
jgi:hypothetical protein